MVATADPELVDRLQQRFETTTGPHPGITWAVVREQLAQKRSVLEVLSAMEASGGGPDIAVLETDSDRLGFMDCSMQSRSAQLSLCHDRCARASRKTVATVNSAAEAAGGSGDRVADRSTARRAAEPERVRHANTELARHLRRGSPTG